MKTKLLLLRGLAASVLMTLGFARIGEHLDPVLDQASMVKNDDDVLRLCDQTCYLPPPPGPGDESGNQNARVTTVA